MKNKVEIICSSRELGAVSYYFAGVVAITGLMAGILTLSKIFHSGLRRLGQPSVISHILAGVVVGPTVIGRILPQRLGMEETGDSLYAAIRQLHIVFIFFIGLEMDLYYLLRNLHGSIVFATGGSAFCLLLAAFVGGPFFYVLSHPLGPGGKYYSDTIAASSYLFALVLTSTSSPVIIRVVTELKLTGSKIGQLAIGAAVANDLASLATISLISTNHPTTYDKDGRRNPPAHDKAWTSVSKYLWTALYVWITVSAVVWTARLVNRMKRGRRYISMCELFSTLTLVVVLPQYVQKTLGYSAFMIAFFIGLAMPRQGPTARTLIDRLGYPVHEVITPLVFGVMGARLDFTKMGHLTAARIASAIALATAVSTAGRVAGTLLAGKLLGVAAQETAVLGLLLNVKGHADILVVNYANRIKIWDEATQALLLTSSIINVFMAGPASAAIVRQQRRAAQYRSRCLQDLEAHEELRVLVCVHSARSIHAMLTLAGLSTGSGPIVVYLLHLIELMSARKYAITGVYRNIDADSDNAQWGYAREVAQVAAAVSQSAVPVRQIKAISDLASMDADVCNSVEDTRASLVIVPFHKEQLYDGHIVCRDDRRRLLNQRILRKAPCTVGVLVERRLPSIAGRQPADGQPRFIEPAEGAENNVVAVFLGGPDDREVVTYAARLAAHPSVSVTVSRFLPTRASMDASCRRRPSLRLSKAGDDFVTMVVGEEEEEAVANEEFMADFYARFVEPGVVSYMERYVGDGAEMVDSLRSMMGMYALFIVGRGHDGAVVADMTGDMGVPDEECPELGHIGELLSSDDLVGCCTSVLVIQKHSAQQN